MVLPMLDWYLAFFTNEKVLWLSWIDYPNTTRSLVATVIFLVIFHVHFFFPTRRIVGYVLWFLSHVVFYEQSWTCTSVPRLRGVLKPRPATGIQSCGFACAPLCVRNVLCSQSKYD